MATNMKSIREKIQYNFDKQANVLYISFGKPKNAICVEKEEGIFFRVDPFKDKIVGITVMDFKERFEHLSKKAIIKFAENKLAEFQN